MSSHHVIREDQEPSLLIVDAQAIPFEKVQELLEWIPTVIVVAEEVETVVRWGIKIDVVLTPLAEMSRWQEQLIDQVPIRFLSYNPDDDPLLTAFYFLNASKAKAVNCLLKNNDDLKTIEAFSQLDVEAFIQNKRWIWVKSGHFEKWVPAGNEFYIQPEEAGESISGVSDGKITAREDGKVTLHSIHPFWIGETLT